LLLFVSGLDKYLITELRDSLCLDDDDVLLLSETG